MLDFNINHNVFVQLTPTGITEMKRQHDELYDDIGIESTFKPPKEDSDGWSEWQLWHLMNTFGHMTRMGVRENPFNLTIRIGT
jgi:hypothetical protein